MNVLPLTSDEELLWRSLMKLVFVLPRAIEEDLQRSCGLSSSQYSVLMHLSEAPDRQLRMSDLAGSCGLSPSRITRVIDEMSAEGLVERRRPESSDGRSTLAVLTKRGMSTLRRAWPHHIRSVRALAFDHLSADEASSVGHVLERLAEGLDNRTG